MNRKWRYSLLALLGLAVIMTVGIGVYHWYSRAKIEPALAVEVNLLNPDAFLNTQSLSKLPKDLLTAPVLQHLALEDLFFYYRENEGRLSLEGTLRRISFEHELYLSDRFLATIFDRPARIAFWKSRDGRLGRWLTVVRREGLVPVLEALAKTALADSQLRIAGELPGPGAPQVFELSYGRHLKLYFASAGDHLLLFSDPGILLHTEAAELEKVNRLLSAENPTDLWAQSFRLDVQPHVHTFAVSANYLSLGYQALFPALHALRFDYDAPGWTAAISTSDPLPTAAKVWNAVPDHPALCAVVPIDPDRTAALLSKVVSADDAERLADALEPPAAVCWYDKTKLYAPLVAIRKNSKASLNAALQNLFRTAIGTHEAGEVQAQAAPPSAAKPAQQAGEDETAEDPVVVYHPPFEVLENKQANGMVWRREVSSPYGIRPREASEHSEDMRSGRYFTVALAEWQDTLLFSPDATLVDDAIAVLEGRYPALGDALPENSETAVVMYSDRLVNMVTTALLDSLPGEREPIFRASVSERLLPELEKLKDGRIMRLPAPTGKTAWEPLKWSE
ncbi:DUF2138 family protein [Methylobacter sp. YRD-M1]|uniref:DUF2138 family protein n=1 Tax=Methylobacter sp. YRD-M1 TaxID=2911520 RepID=UPI00227C8969|nr:DUF2138 family protein [Methylobacter sp. YRD-M1]WAK03567.1 DUF2138 family protein [Methylobacter sp. YRD-M1]